MTGGRVLRGGIGRGADNDRSDVDDDEIRCLQPGPRCLSLVPYLLPTRISRPPFPSPVDFISYRLRERTTIMKIVQ
jgi:hypothetical protein